MLLEKGEIKADEIWNIYNTAPRIPQVSYLSPSSLSVLIFSVFFRSFDSCKQKPVRPVDEYGALIYAGRWGIHGVSLPGRVTFSPGNIGFATFGAPRPMEVYSRNKPLIDDRNINHYNFFSSCDVFYADANN